MGLKPACEEDPGLNGTMLAEKGLETMTGLAGGLAGGLVQRGMLGHLCRRDLAQTPVACFYKASVVGSLSPVKERG